MQGLGCAWTALRENREIWIHDIPNTRPTAAFPLHRSNEVVGVFVLIAGSVDSFAPDARALLSEMASDVDFALDYFEKEAQRERAQAQLELVLKGSMDAPWECQLSSLQTELSPQGWHMLGYGVDEMPPGPMRIKALVHPQDLARMAPLQERLQAPGDSVVIEEVRLRHRSGRYVPVLRFRVTRPFGATGAGDRHRHEPHRAVPDPATRNAAYLCIGTDCQRA